MLAAQDDAASRQPVTNIEIPFQFQNENLVIVKATIGSLRNLNMLLDTGTNPSTISKEVADKLGLPRTTADIKALNGTMRVESAVLPALEFGPLYRDAVQVMVQDLSFLERNVGISLGGIIGLDILSASSFTIDYRRKSITFGVVPTDLKTVPLATIAPSLTIQARIDGREVRLLLDSGTGGLVLYRDPKALAVARIDRKASILTSSGSTRLSWLKTRVSIGEEDLGIRKIAIADVDSNFGDEFDGLMGFTKMGFHRVAFDFDHGRFGWN